MSAPVLRFRASGLSLGVFLGDVGRVLVATSLVPVPFTHRALLGLFPAEEGALPVFDLALLDENQPRAPFAGSTLVALFPTPRGPAGLRVEALEGSVPAYDTLAEEEAAALRAAIPPAIRKTLTGAARVGDAPFWFFSPDAFIAAVGL